MILDDILAVKRREVAAAKASVPVASLRARPQWIEPRRGFARALAAKPGRAIIAEIKKASPSRGVIREHFDPPAHALSYARAGAACISVLTDAQFFQGSLDHLSQVHAVTTLPTIRKDFTIDAYQIAEARAYGADAVLLIVAALDRSALAELAKCAADEGLDVLVEVHDEGELDVAVGCGAKLIGINNRDLRTFHTTLDVTRRLAPRVPAGTLVVAESGIHSTHDIAALEAVGVRAFLVGEHLMAAPDPGVALASLIGP